MNIFKSTREKLYPKLSEEKLLKKFVELLYSSLITPEVEKYVELIEKPIAAKIMMQSSCFDNSTDRYNVEEIQTILILEYKKKMITNHCSKFFIWLLN